MKSHSPEGHSSNALYYGDNLNVLRESIADESVDLIYLDPPFNSKRDYNLLFKSPEGHESHAQITAFEDSWHWGEQAEREFEEIVHGTNTELAQLIPSLRAFLGENDMLAYLVMMANRLIELHRVLKPTGSLYLHCDSTASHYLKLVLDGVFGPERFLNEIIWKRTSAHNSGNKFGPVHDSILFYGKTDRFNWNQLTRPLDESYEDSHYTNIENGRRYKRQDMTGAGVRNGATGEPWRGIDPTPKGRHWGRPPVELDKLDAEGRVYWPPKAGAWPYLKLFLDEREGMPIQDVWDDIFPINPIAKERLGYPTQKPLALLERIIEASSNPGDIVLDPFCGCGTAVDAAQKTGRKWLGIDITHLAVSLIEKRMKDRYPGITFEVHGTPKDVEGARDLAQRDKYQFQWWACSLINAQPYGNQKKGADGGVDGIIFFGDVGPDGKKATQKIIVSVKGGDHVTVNMIRDLKGTVEGQKAAMGVFLTLTPPTKPMKVEAASGGFYKGVNGKQYPRIQILTVEELLEGHQHPVFPDLSMGTLTFKPAKKEQAKDTGSAPSLFEGIS